MNYYKDYFLWIAWWNRDRRRGTCYQHHNYRVDINETDNDICLYIRRFFPKKLMQPFETTLPPRILDTMEPGDHGGLTWGNALASELHGIQPFPWISPFLTEPCTVLYMVTSFIQWTTSKSFIRVPTEVISKSLYTVMRGNLHCVPALARELWKTMTLQTYFHGNVPMYWSNFRTRPLSWPFCWFCNGSVI